MTQQEKKLKDINWMDNEIERMKEENECLRSMNKTMSWIFPVLIGSVIAAILFCLIYASCNN